MPAIITLPVDFASSALAYVGQLFTDLQLYIIVLIGLPLAFWAVRKVIGLFSKRA